MGKCSCGLSENMPKCDGSCKKKPNKIKKKKSGLEKKYKALEHLCASLLLYIYMKNKK